MSWLSSLKSVFSPAQEVKQEEVQQVLQTYVLPHSTETLAGRVSQINIEGRVLQITINTFPAEADHLQQIHDELADALEKCGIQELNLHVIQQKIATTGQPHSAPKQGAATAEKSNLPPVVDAAAMPSPQAARQPTQSAAPVQTATQTATATQVEPEVDPNNPPIQKAAPQQRDVPKHPRIQHVIVVSSGKGGVGKSTTTVNLALALHQLGLKVGVLDADIYGPSIPTMLGNAGRTPMIEAENFVPIEAYGMPVLSIGHLTGDHNTPVAWRGPKATGALMQLFNQTLWPDLDVLMIDMPPGTGDIQLTLAQRIPVTGAIIVTTPQNVALMDATKGIELFNKVQIPVMGVIENMSTHICSNCGFEEQIFGTGGGDKLAAQYDIPLLGRLPLNVQIRENADAGKPSVVAGDSAAESYLAIAEKIAAQLPLAAKDPHRIF
ncbi:ATP-binding protein involved in chromosome partitioning [Acinetobacter calcoaceticus]|uniref:Iron-sulfur cluster carrier protein n=1 Tax=Acinetobacter calcoaceticus TaxID=471 RepID=A0A4R1XNX0_ACICA|nr:ATP-binding protein involved in chromosome partitioning [Acinetobacter calcoaceticus]